MITGVGLPSGYQTRLVAWNAAPRAKILCRETAQVSRHSVHPTIDLTVDPRVPVGSGSVSGAIRGEPRSDALRSVRGRRYVEPRSTFAVGLLCTKPG